MLDLSVGMFTYQVGPFSYRDSISPETTPEILEPPSGALVLAFLAVAATLGRRSRYRLPGRYQ